MPLKRIILGVILLLSTGLPAQNRITDSLYRVLPACKNDTERIKTLAAICIDYGTQYMPDSMIKVSVRALGEYEKSPIKAAKAIFLETTATAYMLQDIYSKATDYAQQAQKVCRRAGLDYLEAHMLSVQGFIFRHQEDYASAIRFYTKAVDRPIVGSHDDLRITLEQALGEVCNLQGNYDLALTHYRAALNIQNRKPDTLAEGEIYGEIARVYLKKGDELKALACAEKARVYLLNKHADAASLMELMIVVSKAFLHENDSAKVYDWALRALQIANRSQYRFYMIEALENLGHVHAYFKDTATATYYYSQELQYAEKFNYPRGIATANDELAFLLPDRDSAKKMKLYTDALATQTRLHLWNEQAGTLERIATLYYSYVSGPDAKHIYVKVAADSEIHAYTLYKSVDNIGAAARAAFSVGEMSIDNNLPVQALTYYSKAYKIQKHYPCMHKNMARTIERLGYTYLQKGDFSKAYDNIYKAQTMQEDSGYKHDLWLTYKHKALYFLSQDNKKLSLQYYARAHDTAKAVNEKKALPGIDYDMANVYLLANDTNLALEHFSRSLKESEDINSMEETAKAGYRVANIYLRRRKYNEAERHYMHSINYANVAHDNAILMYCYYELYQVYIATNQKDAASQAYDNYRAVMKTLPPEVGR